MASTKVRPLDLGFSVADADPPLLHLEEGKLVVSFCDWREVLVTVSFSEVYATRWQTAEELLPDEPFDGCVEVLDSPWLRLHNSQRVSSAEERIRHINLNFNACGKLSVLLAGEIGVLATGREEDR